MLASVTPISRYRPTEDLSGIHPEARIFLDRGVFFVGIQGPFGREIFGWGNTVRQAVDMARGRRND